jgi:hypothetical protein
VNDEFEWMCEREREQLSFVLKCYWRLLGGMRKHMEDLSEAIWPPIPSLNLKLPEFEAEVIITQAERYGAYIK